MPPPDAIDPLETAQPSSSIQCEDCAAALSQSGEQLLSFLLLDELTIPVVGCETHLGEFSDMCELTSTNAADLLEHRPAGGIPCPSCHLAPFHPTHAVLPVQQGAVGIISCQAHRDEIVSRYRTGVETYRQMTTSLDSAP